MKEKKVSNKQSDIFSAPKKQQWWRVVASVFLLVAIVCVGAVSWFEWVNAGKIFPGVHVGVIDVTGMTHEQVLTRLKQVDDSIQHGLTFRGDGTDVTVEPVTIATTDPDLAKPIIYYDWTKTADDAYRVGRGSTFIVDLFSQLRAVTFGKTIVPHFQFDRQELENTLRADFSKLEKPPVNATLRIVNDRAEVTGERSGEVFDYTAAVDEFERNATRLSFEPITLTLAFKEPEIKQNSVATALQSIDRVLAIESITLVNDDQHWTISQRELRDWLEFQKKDSVVVVGANRDKVLLFLDPIKAAIDVPAQDAKFTMEGGRVTEFQSSQDGKTLDAEAAYQKINDQVIAATATDIMLPVAVELSTVENDELNTLGIKELIGRGTSNFKGSPKNRRHNIATGASKLNGILIQPNEEFSLLDALGEIDGANGYLQELVIKGNRTIPEYGGGLCQIGTTTFRAALYSGLPILQRRNHSYRVVYYEPAGMDATIYDPAPDMKFLNDTGHHILFVTKIDGDNLIFEFYGTKDGRQVTLDPPVPKIYNVTSPGEPRYIETEELAPGEKKKSETAHAGADTYFKYTVVYANGEQKEQEFFSHYIPWPEVWLVGKEPTAATSTEPIASESPLPIINESN